jgi:hypothetical protein
MQTESGLLCADKDRSEFGLRFTVEVKYAPDSVRYVDDLRESRSEQLLLGGMFGLLGVGCHGG